jgi:hypothetical protein
VRKTRRSVVADGRLTVPLFHGTSTLFYESIVAAGLGGRNIVEDLNLRTVVRSLLDLCETELPHDASWASEKAAALKIGASPSLDSLNRNWGFNFRYGGTYVSASRRTAETYALLYNCGSEALAYTPKLLERLSQHRPGLAAREEFSEINALARKHREPRIYDLVVQQHNFELLQVVPTAHLRFYRAKWVSIDSKRPRWKEYLGANYRRGKA